MKRIDEAESIEEAFALYEEAQRRLRRRTNIAYLIILSLGAAAFTALGFPLFGLATAFMAGMIVGGMI